MTCDGPLAGYSAALRILFHDEVVMEDGAELRGASVASTPWIQPSTSKSATPSDWPKLVSSPPSGSRGDS